MIKQDAVFSGGMLLVIALVLALLCGCTVDQSWKPVVGDDYKTTRAKLDLGTKYITIEGDEVRWWFEHPAIATHWIYYAKFDRHIVTWKVITGGEKVDEYLSPALLVEWARNHHAYREAKLPDGIR
jgi:hypothetical protein